VRLRGRRELRIVAEELVEPADHVHATTHRSEHHFALVTREHAARRRDAEDEGAGRVTRQRDGMAEVVAQRDRVRLMAENDTGVLA